MTDHNTYARTPGSLRVEITSSTFARAENKARTIGAEFYPDIPLTIRFLGAQTEGIHTSRQDPSQRFYEVRFEIYPTSWTR